MILLPGTIEGLLRRGSPVVTVEEPPLRGVVTEPPTEHRAKVSCCHLSRIKRCLFLDLAEANGRAHAVQWAQERGVDLSAQADDPAALQAAALELAGLS